MWLLPSLDLSYSLDRRQALILRTVYDGRTVEWGHKDIKLGEIICCYHQIQFEREIQADLYHLFLYSPF